MSKNPLGIKELFLFSQDNPIGAHAGRKWENRA